MAQEIILHTLFSHGTTRIQDLERYITDDVLRHGNRLLELEKKLANAYAQEAAAAVENGLGAGVGMGVVDDEMLFGGKVGADGGEEGDEEDSAFVMFVSSWYHVWFRVY